MHMVRHNCTIKLDRNRQQSTVCSHLHIQQSLANWSKFSTCQRFSCKKRIPVHSKYFCLKVQKNSPSCAQKNLMDCHITLLSDTHPWRPCATLIHNWQLYVENTTIKYCWDEVHCLGSLEVIYSLIKRTNKPEGHQVPHACHRCQATACLFEWKFCKRKQQLRLSSGCMPSGDIMYTISQEYREASHSEQLITKWKWPPIKSISKYKIDHLHLLKRKAPNAPMDEYS